MLRTQVCKVSNDTGLGPKNMELETKIRQENKRVLSLLIIQGLVIGLLVIKLLS